MSTEVELENKVELRNVVALEVCNKVVNEYALSFCCLAQRASSQDAVRKAQNNDVQDVLVM